MSLEQVFHELRRELAAPTEYVGARLGSDIKPRSVKNAWNRRQHLQSTSITLSVATHLT
jgi:hypothetical protein